MNGCLLLLIETQLYRPTLNSSKTRLSFYKQKDGNVNDQQLCCANRL